LVHPADESSHQALQLFLTKGVRAVHSRPPEWLAVSLQVKSGNFGRPNRQQQQLIEEKGLQDFDVLPNR
jgi:hypothetical protein